MDNIATTSVVASLNDTPVVASPNDTPVVASPSDAPVVAVPTVDIDKYMNRFDRIGSNVDKMRVLLSAYNPTSSANDRVMALMNYITLSHVQFEEMYELCIEMNNFFSPK